jgi:hypothetical protein
MTEHASNEITINVRGPHVLEAILELDEYWKWIEEVTRVDVYERDSRGRALRAKITSNAMGNTIMHIYRYDYSHYPDEIKWELESGNMVNTLHGSYTIKEGSTDSTIVRYDLDVELSSPLPGFLKRKAAKKIVTSALTSLKTYCESR